MKEIFNTLKRQEVILVASVHHTGTWFTLNILAAHPQIPKFDTLRDIKEEHVLPNHLLHQHIDERTDVHYNDHVDDVYELCRELTTVCPVRDPLLSIISREERHPELSHSFLVDGFKVLKELQGDVVFFPIDLPLTKQQRVYQVRTMCGDLGLEWAFGYIDEIAEKWKPINTKGSYPLKAMYNRNDLTAIRRRVDEVEYLLDNKDELKPFMQSLGYQNLMWY